MATEDWVNAQGFAKEGTVFHYMGSVATVSELEAIETKSIGDVYNVTESGSNYVWTGAAGDPEKPHQIGWDKLSETIVVTDSFTETITNIGDDADKAIKSKSVFTALEGKVDKVVGKQLSTEDFTTALKTKLEALAEINAVETSQLSIDADKKLSITAVDKSLITGLDAALNGKVDKVDGKQLSTEDYTTDEKTKLGNMVEIDSVETSQMSIDPSTKKLSITAIAQNVVTGLDTALGGKVDKVEGKELSTNDFTDAFETKLTNMVEIDSVDTTQLTISEQKKLSVTAIATSVVTGLDTALSNITTDITNMCNGTKAFTGIKFEYNSKYYTLAVAMNTLGQPTLYLEEIAG